MELEYAQESFVRFLGQLRQDCKLPFLEWVCKEYNPRALESNGELMEEEDQESDAFERITEELKEVVPPTALSPGEAQLFPNKESVETNTLHVDSFLYPKDEDIDQLCSQLDISRHYCLQCGSWKTAPLNLISHSMSREEIQFIFTDLLSDLTGKTVVDVGSRLGPVLYGAFYLSKASCIVGIELNKYFCDLQQQVVDKHNMSSRVQIVCSDVMNQGALLTNADVIVLNNVFEMFCTLEERAKIWEFLFSTIRKRGTLIVTIPSIQQCWKSIPIKATLELKSWVVEMSTNIDPSDEDLGDLHLYCVL